MLKHKSIIGLRELVFGTLISVLAISAFTALSTSAHAGEKDIAVTADKLNWEPFGDTAQLAMLWGNIEGGEYAMLVKFPPGWKAGPHSHSADYHAVILQGNMVHIFGDDDVRPLPPGSYFMQSKEELHNDVCAGPDECIAFLHQHAPFDFIPKEVAANQ